jgi:hypothetical protein
LRVREAPIDLWLVGIVWLIGLLLLPLTWVHIEAQIRSQYAYLGREMVDLQLRLQIVTQIAMMVLFACVFLVAAFRRRLTDRR